MSKYHKLSSHLASCGRARLQTDFKEIEAILGFPLPSSAYQYQAWWANGGGHSQSAAWNEAGWRTEDLDLGGQKVTFVQIPTGSKEPADSSRKFLRPNSIREGDSCGEEIPQSKELSKTGLTMAEAKSGLASYFGVPPENIEIIIKG